jgi:ribosome-associated protein
VTDDTAPGAVPDHALLRVTDDLVIPLAELDYRASRSGGAGGQHVNTSSTRIEVELNVATSPSFSDSQRARILEKLATRIDSAGILRLTSSGSRSQFQNKEDVTARLARILADALKEQKPRRKTKMPRAAKEARLQEKKKRSQVKKDRGAIRDE